MSSTVRTSRVCMAMLFQNNTSIENRQRNHSKINKVFFLSKCSTLKFFDDTSSGVDYIEHATYIVLKYAHKKGGVAPPTPPPLSWSIVVKSHQLAGGGGAGGSAWPGQRSLHLGDFFSFLRKCGKRLGNKRVRPCFLRA
jgi:hypothetical protein